jgi:CTP:molybdopterin cytidylyltransferase MocA
MSENNKRKQVDGIVGRILATSGELPPETTRDAIEYIRTNPHDIDGIVAIACAAARTIATEHGGDSETSPRRLVIHEALSSQSDPQRLDKLTRALLHETRASVGAAQTLADYFASHPQQHDWAKTIRDHIVIDIPDAIRNDTIDPFMPNQHPFDGVKRVFQALIFGKRAEPILQALRPYTKRFDPYTLLSDFPTLGNQLREDYPNDSEHATAALMLFASDARGDTPEDICSGFMKLLNTFDDDAIVKRVIETAESFKIPLPLRMAEGIVLHGAPSTEQTVKRAFAYWKSLANDSSPTGESRSTNALEFTTRLAKTPSGITAFISFLAETPDFDNNTREKLLYSLADRLVHEARLPGSANPVTFTAGVVDLYRRGLIDGIDGDTAFVVGTALFGGTGAHFMRYLIPSERKNAMEYLLEYLATTDLGKDGNYDSIKTDDTLRRIMRGTEWIDAILRYLDNAENIGDGQQMVDQCLLPALIARPEHTQHAVNQLKQRMDNAKSLQEQAICACAFGHLCQRLHDVRPYEMWTLPRRKALERQLQLVRPAMLGRARMLRNALASSIQDIHQSRTLTDAEFLQIYETLRELDTAIDSIVATAFDPDFDTPPLMRELRRQLFAEPTGLLTYPSGLWEYQKLNNEQLVNRLCN